MRVSSSIKIREAAGSRLPYHPREAEVRENKYKYLAVDGILVPDGEGILYWVDTIVTTDAGGSIVYDNTAASGRGLSAAYATKKDEGVLKSWDPPKRYFHGVYVNLTNSLVEICFKPLARNLRCKLTVPPRFKLFSRVTVRRFEHMDVSLPPRDYGKLFGTVEVEREGVGLEQYTKNLPSKIMVSVVTSKSLLPKVYVNASYLRPIRKNLVCKVYADRTP